MEKTRQEEIKKVHNERHIDCTSILKDEKFKRDIIINATTTYTNLCLFANDYDEAYELEQITIYDYVSAINDLYLLALQHITDEQYDLLLLKESVTI